MAHVERGDVVLLNFNEVSAETMTKTRPALIVQNNAGNRAAPYTIVAAIHHETGKFLPINVSVSAGNGGLAKDSVVDLGHI
ncbi:MAG: type II toxin-antitoxin system PemK/MazF family toxin, partial [Elusimicrobiota bacterium]